MSKEWMARVWFQFMSVVKHSNHRLQQQIAEAKASIQTFMMDFESLDKQVISMTAAIQDLIR